MCTSLICLEGLDAFISTGSNTLSSSFPHSSLSPKERDLVETSFLRMSVEGFSLSIMSGCEFVFIPVCYRRKLLMLAERDTNL